jgi:catechol 2,3-dioxygenase-like lactoylglutathione lyase family enzyme
MHSKPAIRCLLGLLPLLIAIFPTAVFAQLTPFNESGVTMGHVHLLVPDPEAHKKLWVDLLGAQIGHAGALELVKLPGIVILINKTQPGAIPGEPVADHFALVVKDLASIRQKLASANIQLPVGQAIAAFPDGVRVEFIEDKNLGVPVAFHHFHIFTADVEAIRNWYVKTFGGVEFPAGANFPGGKMYFTAQSSPARVPSKGHPLDHISFDVRNLQEFCKKLEAQGTKLDMQIIDASSTIGLKVTFVTDPIGTRIELTEGLAGK